MMSDFRERVICWLGGAEAKVIAAGLDGDDLRQLREICEARPNRQCLLYLHARELSIQSSVLAMDRYDPDIPPNYDLEAEPDFPYPTVLDAIRDGWQVIQFPSNRAPFDDRENDVLGYEFILQRMEG